MLAAIIIALAIIADQVTKYFVVQAAAPIVDGRSSWAQEFIPGVLSFRYRENNGGGWSILDGGGIQWFLLNAISIAAIVFMIVFLVKYYRRHPLLSVSLAMILGGAMGHMIDRLRLRYVVDFLHTEFMEFPTFNIADCFITVGAISLGVYIIFYDAKVEKRLLAEKEANEKLIEIKPDEVSSETEEENEQGGINTEEKGEND